MTVKEFFYKRRRGLGFGAMAVFILVLMLVLFSGGIGSLIFSIGVSENINVAANDIRAISAADFFADYAEEDLLPLVVMYSDYRASYVLGHWNIQARTEWNETTSFTRNELEELYETELQTAYEERERDVRGGMQGCRFPSFELSEFTSTQAYEGSREIVFEGGGYISCSEFRTDARVPMTDEITSVRRTGFVDIALAMDHLTDEISDQMPTQFRVTEDAEERKCWTEYDEDDGQGGFDDSVGEDEDEIFDDLRDEARDESEIHDYEDEPSEAEDEILTGDYENYELEYGHYTTYSRSHPNYYNYEDSGLCDDTETKSCDPQFEYTNIDDERIYSTEDPDCCPGVGSWCSNPDSSYEEDRNPRKHVWENEYEPTRASWTINLTDPDTEMLVNNGVVEEGLEIEYEHNLE